MVAASFGFDLLEVGFAYVKRVSVTKLSALTIRDTRNRLTQHIQTLPVSTVETYHSGDLVSRLTNDLQQTISLYRRAPDTLHQPLQFTGGLLFMLPINPKADLGGLCRHVNLGVHLRADQPAERTGGTNIVPTCVCKSHHLHLRLVQLRW